VPFVLLLVKIKPGLLMPPEVYEWGHEIRSRPPFTVVIGDDWEIFRNNPGKDRTQDRTPRLGATVL